MWQIDEEALKEFYEHVEDIKLMPEEWIRSIANKANEIELTPEKLAEHLEKIKEMTNILGSNESGQFLGIHVLNNYKDDVFKWIE